MNRKKTFRHFSVNIDTLRGSTQAALLVPVSKLIAKGWRYHCGPTTLPNSYTKFINNIYFEFYPISGYIVASLSAPKIMTGSNTSLFNFDEIDLLFSRVNVLIKNSIQGLFKVPSFKFWNATRIDINVDIPFLNDEQKRIFLDLFSKLSISRRQKVNYLTGTQFISKSMNGNAYDKEREIQDRDPSKVSEADEIFLADISATHVRVEFQIKKVKLTNLFKGDRSFEVLLTRENIDNLYSYFLNQFKLELRILTKETLFDFIDTEFKAVKARNMKRLIEDLNELTPDEFENLHKINTKNAYANCLRKLGVNIYYFSKNPGVVVDFINKTVYYGKKPTLSIIDVMQKVVELIMIKLPIKIVHNFKVPTIILTNQLTHQYPDRGS